MKLFVLLFSTDHSGGPTVHLTKRAALNELRDAMDCHIPDDGGATDEAYEAELNAYFEANRESLFDYWEIHETEINALVLPMNSKDNAVLETEDEAPDIEWRSKAGDRLWVGVDGKLDVKIKHDDEGVSVDIYETGSVGDAIAGTWHEWPAEEGEEA